MFVLSMRIYYLIEDLNIHILLITYVYSPSVYQFLKTAYLKTIAMGCEQFSVYLL